MPRYRKKITRQMSFDEFEKGIKDLAPDRQAFLAILFYSGCRVSEALALRAGDGYIRPHVIYLEFKRLKGSKQTDPIPIPRNQYTEWIVTQYNKLFEFSRMTAYRTVKKAFPDLYPHFFRMNRITKISEEFGDSYVYSFVGICAQSIDHYRAKVDIKKVSEALLKE